MSNLLIPMREPPAQKGRGVTALRLGNRDGWACWYCGQPLCPWVESVHSKFEVEIGKYRYYACETWPQIEHKVPRCRGGRTTLENCVIACGTCNSRKGRMTTNEFFEVLYYWELEHQEELARLRNRWDDVFRFRDLWW